MGCQELYQEPALLALILPGPPARKLTLPSSSVDSMSMKSLTGVSLTISPEVLSWYSTVGAGLSMTSHWPLMKKSPCGAPVEERSLRFAMKPLSPKEVSSSQDLLARLILDL